MRNGTKGMTLVYSGHEMEILAGVASASTVLDGYDGALDVDVQLLLDGGLYLYLEVETTVVPDEVNGGYRPYGEDASMWVESGALAAIQALDLPESDQTALLLAIAGEACAEARKQGRKS